MRKPEPREVEIRMTPYEHEQLQKRITKLETQTMLVSQYAEEVVQLKKTISAQEHQLRELRLTLDHVDSDTIRRRRRRTIEKLRNQISALWIFWEWSREADKMNFELDFPKDAKAIRGIGDE